MHNQELILAAAEALLKEAQKQRPNPEALSGRATEIQFLVQDQELIDKANIQQ